ncbi:hypothetical protein PVA38_11940 [Streptococcus pneumoniae D39]|nr:hypothetical protein PVA38_11940 [Streptococcus pneumoniae D39]
MVAVSLKKKTNTTTCNASCRQIKLKQATPGVYKCRRKKEKGVEKIKRRKKRGKRKKKRKTKEKEDAETKIRA